MRTKGFHKLTAWLLTLAMLMTFMPGFTFTASAAVEEAKWGTSAESLTDSGTFAEAVAAVNAGTAGCIQLQSNVTSEKGFEITRGSLTLDLNGKTIDVTYSPNALGFSGTELIIQDSGTGGTIRNSYRLGMTGLFIAGGTVELKSGTLDAHEAVTIYGDSSSFTQSGGAVNGRITVMSGSCTLSGGTFSGNFIWHGGRLILEKLAGAERYRLTAMQTMPVSAVTLPDGWKLADKNESEFTGEAIEPNGYVYVTACAASVTTSGNETTYYLHLDEAVEAACDNYGSTVKLLRDVELYHPIHIGNASFTLDLNGKTITSDHSIFEILTYSFITLTDSSAEQSGRMTVNSQSESAILLYEAVQLTIDGGTVETRGSYAVDMSNEGRATNSWLMMEGGKLIGGHAAINASGDRVVFNGGTLEHTRSTGVDIHYSHGHLELLYYEDSEGISVLNGSSADIKASDVGLPPYFVFYDEAGDRVRSLASGGTYTIGRGIPLCDEDKHNWKNRDGVCWRCEFVCEHDFCAEYVCKICGYAYPVVVIHADGVTKTYYPDLPAAIEAASGLTDSTVTPREDITLDDKIVISSGDFIIDLAGRTIENSGRVFDVKGNSKVVITDSSADKSGRVLGSSGSIPVLVYEQASLTVSGSTIEGGVSAHGDSTLTVEEGGKLISRSTALTVDGGSVTIDDGSIEGSSHTDILYLSGTLNLSGLYLPSGVTFRNGGTAIAASDIALPDGYAFFDSSQNKADTLIPAKPYTSVYTIRKVLPPCADGEHEWTNREGVCVKCENAHVHEGDTDDPYTCYYCGYVYPAAVTSGGSTTVYKTLDDALIFAVSHEDSTVTLRDDIREDRSYEITGGRFTIDLRGKAVIGSLTLYNDADVTITDSSDEKNGQLTSAETNYPAITLMGSASLTVSGGTIEASGGTAIDMPNSANNESTFVMTGGKLIGLIDAGGSSVTVSGGSIESDTVDIRYRSGKLDLSGHNDPVGITVQNESGESIYVSESGILAESYVFFNVEGNPIRILEDRTLYTVRRLPVAIYVGEARLSDGQYLASGSSVPTDTMPDGGYAYYKDGVLTLHNYVYSGGGSPYTDTDGTYSTTIGSWSDLVIKVEGTNSLTGLSDDSDAITVGEGDLTISGEGTLDVSATYGLYVYGGDVTVEGGTLNIETGLDGIYSGNSTVIEGGIVNISTGDIGINASNDITVRGGRLTVDSDGDGLYAYAGDVTIDGGEVDIEAAVDGIYAYEGYVTISGGKTSAIAGGHGIDGVYVVISDTDTVVAAKGSTAIAAYDSLTIDEGTLEIILPDGGTVGAKTVLDAGGSTAGAAYIAGKGSAEHRHEWAGEYSVDAAGHFKPCTAQDCPLMSDPGLLPLITDEHDFDDDNVCTVCGFNLWIEYDIVIANVGLRSGEYIDNDGNVTAAQPDGGYAHYQDGVLTLNDYRYSGKGYCYDDAYTAAIYHCGDLAISLQGTNSLNNRTSGGEGISMKSGSLTLDGSGSLTVTAACGIYADGSSVTFGGGTINIEAIEVAVLAKNGDVTVGQGTFTAGAGYGGILTENGSVRIENGNVSIIAGAIGISSYNGVVWIAPAHGIRISAYNASSADGEAIDGSPFASETDITGLLSGGAFYSIASALPSSGGTILYTVKFETNGGSAVASRLVARNSKLAEPPEPTKDGYSFTGWFIDEELTTAYDFDARVTESFTLYAGWEKLDDETDPSVWENPFADVKPDDWYYEDVKYVAERGLFNGTSESTFSPDEAITRGMLATVLYRLEGEPEITGTSTFEDVDENAYYAKAVAWAQANGIFKGHSETRFAPDDGITREQIAAVIFRYAKYKGVAPIGAWAIRLDYADLADISDYAADGVMYCTLKGIMHGKGNNIFAPKDTATRAEAAAILHRFIEASE